MTGPEEQPEGKAVPPASPVEVNTPAPELDWERWEQQQREARYVLTGEE